MDGARVDAFGCTDVGKVRTQNQDHFLIASLHRTVEIESTSIPLQGSQPFGPGTRALLLLVADGVGGGAGGEEASTWTLDTIVRYVAGYSRFFFRREEEQEDLLNDLTLAVQWSHAAVRDRTIEIPELAGMATTLTMALVTWPRVFVIQIGDSRCYHLRAAELRRVTSDQTMARELIEQGVLPEATALVGAALHAGGSDNVTVVTARFV